MSSSRAGPVPSRTGVRSTITVTYLSPRRVWRHTRRGDTDHPHPVKAGRVADQYPTSFTQDGIVGGVPRHRQAFGHAGHGEVLTHDRLQRPVQGPPRELPPRLGRPAGVLTPHVPAAGAAVAADRHDQDGGPPTQRLVGEASGHRVAGEALAAAPPTPWSSSMTRQASTARSGSKRCPVTSSPSSSRRQNVVRSGQAKVASGNVAAESWVTAFSCTAQLDSVAGPSQGVGWRSRMLASEVVPDSVARKCAGFGVRKGSFDPVEVTRKELPIELSILRT